MSTPILLVRYGTVPEVARFSCELAPLPARGESVVVQTHRGLQVGTVLEQVRPPVVEVSETEFTILRLASVDDHLAAQELRAKCEADYPRWLARIAEWQLTLELIDLEWTLDGSKQILYVLTERGPDTTNLALQAAAAGLGIIEVQPVAAEGLVALPSDEGGCGSGSCGCH